MKTKVPFINLKFSDTGENVLVNYQDVRTVTITPHEQSGAKVRLSTSVENIDFSVTDHTRDRMREELSSRYNLANISPAGVTFKLTRNPATSLTAFVISTGEESRSQIIVLPRGLKGLTVSDDELTIGVVSKSSSRDGVRVQFAAPLSADQIEELIKAADGARI